MFCDRHVWDWRLSSHIFHLEHTFSYAISITHLNAPCVCIVWPTNALTYLDNQSGVCPVLSTAPHNHNPYEPGKEGHKRLVKQAHNTPATECHDSTRDNTHTTIWCVCACQCQTPPGLTRAQFYARAARNRVHPAIWRTNPPPFNIQQLMIRGY